VVAVIGFAPPPKSLKENPGMSTIPMTLKQPAVSSFALHLFAVPISSC
jgi:hypothetical protein